MSGFFIIIGGFILRLTKLLLKVVLVLFCGKSSIYQFKRGLLSMREFSTHQSLKETPFVNVPILLSVVNDLCYPEERTGATDMEDKTKAGSGGSSDGMSRRAFLQSVGAASGALLAGISNDSSAASTGARTRADLEPDIYTRDVGLLEPAFRPRRRWLPR